MKKSEIKTEGGLLWRIIFGIVLIIFALISLSRSNTTAALLYLIISIFIFIPGEIFKINKNYIKIIIVIIAFFGVVIVNHPSIIFGGFTFEEYELGQEFVLPGDPNFNITVTKAVKEAMIIVGEQEHTTEGLFLLINFQVRFVGDFSNKTFSNKTGLYEIPFSISLGLTDLENNEYDIFDVDTTKMPQTQSLEKLYVFNINKNSTGLIFLVADKNSQSVATVNLGI